MAEYKFATINLFHFAEPGIFWHERKDDKTYTQAEWQMKTDWLSDRLATINADVVGFQEVVSVEALKALAANAGYPHFFASSPPIFGPDDGQVYVNATVAIASRIPFAEVRVYPGNDAVVVGTVIDDGFRFSRDPIEALLELDGIGSAYVYVCHFKSQGAFVLDTDIDAIEDWQEKIATYYRLRSLAGVDQVSKRAAEAGSIYHRFRELLDVDLNVPAILLGDLNEGPESHTIRLLTQSERVYSWGSLAWNSVPEQFVRYKYAYQLYDTWSLAANQTDKRPATHGGLNGEVLDYAIVSNGLNRNNPARKGTVVGAKVYDDHFIASTPKQISSDHAPYVITVTSKD